MEPAHLYCGTSGFAFASWKPDFYPAKLPAKKFLQHYAQRLNAVEINYTFRRLPPARILENWVEETRDGFVFALKAHQRITHIDRLAASEFTRIFFQAIDPLRVRNRLGPVLVQLPPNFPLDLDKLRRFLDVAPDDIPLAFEFRNKSWFADATYEALRQRKAALCLAESEKLVAPPVLTAPFVYFRLRKDNYSPTERQEIAVKVKQLLGEGRSVYVFFKHEETPEGALYAEELLRYNQGR
jgi:uncharacterized protein YecE (DUF72 family)